MKKKQYVRKNSEFIRRNNLLTLWTVISLLVVIISTSLTLIKVPNNIFIVSGYVSWASSATVLVISAFFLYRNFSPKVANKVISDEIKQCFRTLREIPQANHQHDAISSRLSNLIHYAGHDSETMEKVRQYLKKTNFDYILPNVSEQIELESDCSLYQTIGASFEELLGHFKSIGWGEYHHRLRGNMKLSLHEEESRQLKLAVEKINKHLEFISNLEN
jgi:hypothetical protein